MSSKSKWDTARRSGAQARPAALPAAAIFKFLSMVIVALLGVAAAATASEWAADAPYMAYGRQSDVAVIDVDGDLLYSVVPSSTANFAWLNAGTVVDPDPLNPVSNDFVMKGQAGGMARFTAGTSSATEVWVKDVGDIGSGMADSIVYGPDGKIYRQHQWGLSPNETVNTHAATNGNTLLTDILETNPSGVNVLVGGICFGLPGETNLANRLYVSWHTRPSAPADWHVVVAEFTNSSPADLSGTWSEQMYDASGNRSGSGTYHFMESAETSSSEKWELTGMQWGYYGSDPTLFVVGKNDAHGSTKGWGGRYVFGADNVEIAPDNWMNIDTVDQCMGVQLGARAGTDDRTAYVLHINAGVYGLQKWDMDDTDGNPFVASFAAHGGGSGSGVNIIGPGPSDTPAINNDGGATGVTATAAWLNGTLTSTGATPTEVWVYWGTNDAGTVTNSWGNTNYFGTNSAEPDVSYTTNITGLAANTDYYYRFFASNSAGGSWAPTTTNFTTEAAGAITVTATRADSGWGSSSRTWNPLFTFTPGNGVLVVMIAGEHYSGVPTVTYDGVGLTQVTGSTEGGGCAWIYVLANPASSDGSLVVNTGGGIRWGVAALYADGATTNNALSAFNYSASASNLTATLPSAPPAGSIVVSVGGHSAGEFQNPPPGVTGATLLMNLTGAGSGAACDYLLPADGTTNYSATYNSVATEAEAVAIASFAGVVSVPDAPAINNASGATGVTANAAWLNGNLTSTGGAPTEVWVYWGESDGTNNKAGWANTNYFGVVGVGTLSTNLTGLTTNTTYYYRFYASNYSAEVWAEPSTNFITADRPAIENDPATSVLAGSAFLNGELTSDGRASTEIRLYWGTQDHGTTNSGWMYTNYFGTPGLGALSTNITGLSSNTTYYYRFYASNAVEGVWAAPTETFTTLDKPAIDNSAVMNILATSATFNGDLISTGGTPTEVWVYWGTEDHGTTNSGWMYAGYFGMPGLGALSTNITGLSSNTTYYYRFYASNIVEGAWAAYSEQFSTLDRPLIDNSMAMNVLATSASFNGVLNSEGGSSTEVWLYWGTQDQGSTNSGWMYTNYFGTPGVGALSTNLTTLSSNTTYYYRFYASNIVEGTWASPTETFTTLDKPAIANNAATNILAVSAFLNGDLTSDGGSSAEVWVYWGTEDHGTTNSGWMYTNYFGTPGVGPLTTNLTGLSSNTTYYYRFYAANIIQGVWASPTEIFTTLDEPAIINNAATNVRGTSAFLNGDLTSDGGSSTEIWVYWGTQDQGSTNSGWMYTNYFGTPGVGALTVEVTGLDSNTTYYYRFYALNMIDEAWGTPTESFTTPDIPSIQNNAPTGLTDSAAWVNADLTSDGGEPAGVWVYWGETDATNNKAGWANTNYFGLMGTGLLTTNVTDLSPETPYYYRFYASNSAGSAWAAPTTNFSTLAGPPNVANNAATGITDTAAWFNGTLITTGNAPTEVWLFWGETDATNNKAGWANTNYFGEELPGPLTTNIVSLGTNTTYYYRFYASNSLGDAWGRPSVQFTTLDLPDVSNSGATDILGTSAFLNGNLTSTGGAPAEVWVFWGETDATNNKSAWANTNRLGIRTVGAVSTNITGLTTNTTYYYRFYASNSVGAVWAEPSTNFVTAALPSIDNAAATGITATAAWLNGDLTATGGSQTAVWVYWGETDATNNKTGWANTNSLGVRGIGSVTVNIAVLATNTTYYYRFYASNIVEGAWAEPTESFTTLDQPSIANSAATSVLTASATLNGDLTSTGRTPTEVWVFWGTTDGIFNKGAWAQADYFGTLGTGPVSTNITGLDPNTPYYYRFYASNLVGDAWADPAETFTTPGPPVITNTAATGISAGNAVLNGNLTSTGGSPTEVWVYWGETDATNNRTGWANTNYFGIRNTGAVSTNVSGLGTSKTYYYRFYASNTLGGAWASPSAQFTTAEPPAVQSLAATGVTAQDASFNGNLTATGGSQTAVWVFWGDSDAADNKAGWANTNYFGATPIGPLSTNITGLDIDTTYYYRFYASNNVAGTWGEPSISFTTLAGSFGDYPFRMKITFAGYDPPGGEETLINFPALVIFNESLTDFLYSDFGSDEGGDLRFSDSSGTAELNYEIEEWDTGGNSYVWVQVPQLVDPDTCIWAYWGGTDTNPPACTTNGTTWSQNYVGVWHLDQTNAVEDLRDSTLRGTGVQVGDPTNAVGVVAGCEGFNGNDYIDCGNGIPNVPTNITQTAWIWTTAGSGGNAILTKRHTTGSSWATMLNINDKPNLTADSPSSLRQIIGTTTVTDGQWHYVAGVKEGTAYSIYVDGTFEDSDTDTYSINSTLNLHIAHHGAWGIYYNGLIDEVRVSDTVRSSNWIWACWMNVASHGTFNSYAAVKVKDPRPAIDNAAGATGIVTDAAWLNGNLTSTGATPTEVWVYWGETDATNNKAGWTNTNSLGVRSTGPVTVNVSGLDTNTTYYYRFYASNLVGDAWADPAETFTTLGPPASSTTNGTPYAWLDYYNLRTLAGGDYDAADWYDDGDGMAAWEEYYAGTDPTNPDSVLRFISVDTDWRIVWFGGTNGAPTPYNLYMSTNLLEQDGWLWLTNRPRSATPTNEWTHAQGSTYRKIFYKVTAR